MSKKAKAAATAERIRVVIRVRPISGDEISTGHKEAVFLDIPNQNIAVKHDVGGEDRFTFDAVYNNSYSQKDLYNHEARSIVDFVMTGYNATIFAYGQSGSGKTFTMTGAPSDPEMAGIMPNAIKHLFSIISKQQSAQKVFNVKVSHLEIYNGKARDLLVNEQKSLEIKQNMAKNFYVKDLKEEIVTNEKQTLKVFDDSLEHRKTACTDLNEHSSRSHSIFAVSIESMDYELDSTSPVIMHSKLNLVDLAGSERQGKTGASGDTLKEGCNINLSLSALGSVINSLVELKPHIPYRSSPLTMLLKDSLGGNARTVMFANIGPADKNIQETLSTLRFADRAKQIENKPVKNMDPKDEKIQSLLDKIAELTKQLGGESTLASQDELQESMENMEVELANLRESRETEVAELMETIKKQEKHIEELQQTVTEKEQAITELRDQQNMQTTMQSSNTAEVKSVKQSIYNFIKHATTEVELNKIKESVHTQPAEGGEEVNGDKNSEEWCLAHIIPMLGGIRDIYSALKKNTITKQDVNKFLEEQASEFKTKFQAYKKQQEQEKEQLTEQKKQLEASVQKLSQEASNSKVELERHTQASEKATAKLEKEKKKLQEKLDKTRTESANMQDQLEKEKVDAMQRARSDAAKEDAAIKDLRNQITELEEKSAKDLSDSKANFENERKKLDTQLREKQFDIKELNTEIQDLKALNKKLYKGRKELQQKLDTMEADAAKQHTHATNEGGKKKGVTISDTEEVHILAATDQSDLSDRGSPLNETMIAEDGADLVDKEMLDTLHQHIKLHSHMQSLQHESQLKLEELLQHHNDLQQQHQDAKDQELKQLKDQAKAEVEAKDKEIADITEKYEREQEKLLKNMNKKINLFKQVEAQYDEERQALEEEKAEYAESNKELNLINEQLEIEIENAKCRSDMTQQEQERTMKQYEEALQSVREDLELTTQELIDTQKKASELEQVTADRDKLLDENDSLTIQLRDKFEQLENNRQMWKWSSTLLEKERKKTEDLTIQLMEAKEKQDELEEYWRKQMLENANKLVAINNRKLAEQAVLNQQMLEEEQDKQKLVRDKWKKMRKTLDKERQRFDELVLEYAEFQKQFEEFKVSSMRMYRDKQELEIEDNAGAIRDMIRNQNRYY